MTYELRLAIIGGGRLGSAIARGFRTNGLPNGQIVVAQRNPVKLQALLDEGFVAYRRIPDYREFDAIVIAVKPVDVPEVLGDLHGHAQKRTLIISAATGVPCESLTKTLDDLFPLYRVKLSVLGEVQQELIPTYCCTSLAKVDANRQRLAALFAPLGSICEMPEHMMELSGWDISSLAGIIVPQLAMDRLADLDAADARLVEKLLLSGLRNMLAYCEVKQQQGLSLSEIAADLEQRIASPGGLNEAMTTFLRTNAFWQLSSTARSTYKEKLAEVERRFS